MGHAAPYRRIGSLEESALRAGAGFAQADLHRALSQRALRRAYHRAPDRKSLGTIDGLIEDYLAHYTHPSTLANKRRILRGFAGKLAAARLPLSEVTLSFVEQHLRDESRSHSWQGTTLRSAQIELRLFLRRAHQLGHIAEDFTDQIRITRTPQRTLQRFYSVEESQRILTAATQSGQDVARAVHLALLSGLRRGEIMSARGEHIRQDGERTLLHLPYRKGGLASVVALPEVTARIMPRRGRVVGCSVSQLYKLLEQVGQSAGLDHRLRLHALRSSFVTHALDAGQSERDVMLAAGHLRLATTAYYDQGYKAARVGVSDAVAGRIVG